ncbi:hypothetical protein ACQB60_34530 [Actinomycetota bacterium Odt1-20B]
MPRWLARLELALPSRQLVYVLTAVVAFAVGAMISTVVDPWLALPGIVLAAALLWFIAVTTNRSLWLMIPFALATLALGVFALFLAQDRALTDRGSWAELTIVDKSRRSDNFYCQVRYPDGHVIQGSIEGCTSREIGDRIRLFVDPELKADPSTTGPRVALWIWSAAGADIVFTACVVLAAVQGVRRRRQLAAST